MMRMIIQELLPPKKLHPIDDSLLSCFHHHIMEKIKKGYKIKKIRKQEQIRANARKTKIKPKIKPFLTLFDL